MNLIVVVVFTCLGLLSGVESLGEGCRWDKDCLGYVRFSGYRCINRQCNCWKSKACSYYEDVAKREGRYYCSKREHCEAYKEYPGVKCNTYKGNCVCLQHFGCGGCLPRVEVLRMGRGLDETCVFDMYGNDPFWTTLIGTDYDSLRAGDICSDLNWSVTQTQWRIFKISNDDNFEILWDNFINLQIVNARWGNLDDLGKRPINGLYAMKLKVRVESAYGFNELYDLIGYFAGSCAKSYEETGDPKYNASHPYCDSVNQEIIHFGGNVSYNYSYELPGCWDHSAVYFPAEPIHTIQGCSVVISCPSGCNSLQDPQVYAEFTVDIGCSYTMKLIELTARNCATESHDSCVYSEVIRDSSIKSSVKYKPSKNDLSWNYHGLFVKVYLTTANFISGNQLVRYGPIPVVGTCSISPQTGYALITQYNLTCTGFSVTHNLELKYTIKTNHEDSFKTEAAQLLGVITSSLNVAEESGTTSGDTVKKAQVKLSVTVTYLKTVRTGIMTALTEIPVSDIEQVFSAVSILNKATEVKEEISEEAQEVATDLYVSLADNFDSFVANQSSSDVSEVAQSLFDGVTRMLDVNIDTAFKIEQVQLLAQTEVGAPQGGWSNIAVQNTEAIEKKKNSTMKLLNTVNKVSDTLVERQPAGAESFMYETDTMTIGVQKLSKRRLIAASYTVIGASNSSSNFVFPDFAEEEFPDGEQGVKMLYMDKNPYVWAAAGDITSPVMAISVTANNTPVDVHNLQNPVTISLSSPAAAESSMATLRATVVKNRTDLEDQDSGNVTLDETKHNILTFSITAVSDRTISLSIIPHGNTTSFKMLVKTDTKPTLDEIVLNGFLYPEDIPRWLFTSSNYTSYTAEFVPASNSKNDTSEFIQVSDEYQRRLYITPSNPLSMGNFTGNFTGDFNSSNTGIFSGVYYVGITLDLSDSETLLGLKQNYPTCLGSERTDCKEDVETTVEIQTSQLGCFYWDEAEDSWSSQGCEVSPFSTSDTIECLCSHLTSFSGSIMVLPNMVDPFDVELFLTFFDNPVVVTAVIIVWVIYFFIIHWARQADKKDKEKVGVINCPDNNPSNHYVYLVCVVTGWWREAGTYANVFICLKGSKGRSSNHCLTAAGRPCFQSGNDDWFLITTEQSLGNLQVITLWHDNMGTRPHWYLNHVYVKDMQLQKSWHFIYNDWLAVDRGHMLQTSATMEAVTEDEIIFKQKHNFMVKSTQDLRDGHLWVSIFSKPAKSTFTRVQRLTCALSLLLTTMLTNIMFYGIPTDDAEDQVTAGEITFSLSAIIIGIESSLIMFPINLMILQLFLKTRPKPWSRTVQSLLDKDLHVQKVYDASRRMTDMVMRGLLQRIVDNTSSGDVGDENNNANVVLKRSISRMAKESLSSGKWSRGSDVSRDPSRLTLKSDLGNAVREPVPARRNPKVLPWWFLYIAWFLVISTSLISSYFVMLYGLKYGYNKSVSWLVSFLTGFTQSAFVTQPLKVICIAVVITLIFKKPAEFDDFGPDVELDQDEVYLHEVQGAEEIHHPTVQPLSEYLLSKLRHRLYLEWLMDITLRDIILYIIYMAVVIFMVHSHRNVNLAYDNTVAIETMLVRPSCTEEDDCVTFNDASTVEGMFAYLEEILVPLLTDMSASDHEYPSAGSNHFLVGPLRLRQQRIKTGSCDSTSQAIFERFGHDLPTCVVSYSFDKEDTGSYNISWKNPIPQSSSGNGLWSYQSSWKLSTVAYAGDHATYGGGGFVMELPLDNNSVSQLKYLKNTDWLDDHTRVIFVEFTLYNPNVDLFSVVMILFEFTNIGGVFPSHHIFTAKLDHYSSGIGPYVAVCEVLFLLFNIAFTYIEVKRYRKIGRNEYFKDKWSIADIVQIVLAYTVIALFFQRLIAVNSALGQFRVSNGTSFISFYPAIVSDQILGYIMAFLVSVVIVKFLKLLTFNKKMFMIGDTMALSKHTLFGFAIIFVIFMIAFGHFTTLAFGPFLSVYQSFGTSLQTLFQFAIDSSDIIDLYNISHILGPVYFIGFILFSKWCLLQIFTAVLNFGISASKAKTAMRQNKFELVDYIVGKVKDAL